VFGYELGENTELRLLEERHAEQLADLTDRNREGALEDVAALGGRQPHSGG
jgi:hypothetical protein